MNRPALRALFISFFILAGLVLMAQAAGPLLSAFVPAVLPDDVRVIDAHPPGSLPDPANQDDELASLPEDVTVLDAQNDATTVDKAKGVERAATQDASDVQTPVAPATAIAHA